MGKRDNFTADRVARFECPAGKQQAIYWDGKAPGLGLRVTTAGAKSYIFETRLHGRTLRLTIGDVRTWTIGKAQGEATRLKTLTDQGLDPRQQAAEQRATAEAKRQEIKQQGVTVGNAWDAYIAARTPKWGERHLLNHQNLAKAGGEERKRGRRPGESAVTMPGPIYRLLSLRLADLDGEAVRAWLKQETDKGPTQAAQAYRALRAFLSWAADQNDYSGVAHPDACNRRMARDVLPKATAKADCLQREQLEAWFAAVRKIGNPIVAAYLQILLLTGARRNELATLTWDGVDFKWHGITIRDKVEGERIIPMTPYTESLLLDLRRRNDTPPPRIRVLHGKRIENDLANWKPSPWVFASPTAASGRITEPRIAHNQALAVAGIADLTLHGLRRSFKSLSEWVEIPTGVIAQIMGHKPSATAEKHYTVRPLDLLRQWHRRYEAWILDEAGIEFKKDEKQPKPGLKAIGTP